MKGRFEPISSYYSSEMAATVKQCLCRQPHLRPTSEQLLNKDVIIQKCRELGISLERAIAATISSSPSTPKEKGTSPTTPKDVIKKSNSGGNITSRAEEPMRKQIALRPAPQQAKGVARPGSAKPSSAPVMLPVQSTPLVLVKKSTKTATKKQREIDSVKNLPVTLLQKKPEGDVNVSPKNEETTKAAPQKSAPVPVVEEPKVQAPSPEPTQPELSSTQLYNPIEEPDDEDLSPGVSWRISGDSPQDSPTTAEKKSEEAKQHLSELSEKSNELHLLMAKIRSYWVPHVIPKDQFDEILKFLVDLRIEDETEDEAPEGGWTAEAIEEADLRREKRITDYVMERVDNDNLAVVDDMYRLMFIQDHLDKIQAEINSY